MADPASLSESTLLGESLGYARLVALVAGQSGRTWDLPPRTALIGSMEGCDIHVDSREVSRAHCVICRDGNTLRVRDLHSLAGTKLNGKPVGVATLKDGDLLEIGRYGFRVETNLARGPGDGFYIDRFRIVRLLGSGGMSWVYAAVDMETGKKVALKALPSKYSERMLAHFAIEVRAGQRFHHPHVVRTFRIVRAKHVYMAVMEYNEGATLEELLKLNGPVAWPTACGIVRQAALGLQHAHEAGVVHRDIKPSNLLVRRDGLTKVVDFGLSLLSNDPDADKIVASLGRHVIGTADYIAPEQIKDANAIDGRADQYSLGCTLYHVLTGRLPFPEKETPQKLEAHREREPVPLTDIAPQVPVAVVEIVTRMMKKDPADRFADMGEVATALSRFARPEPIVFDFEEILTARLSVAGRRLVHLFNKKKPAGDSSSSPPDAAAESQSNRSGVLPLLQQGTLVEKLLPESQAATDVVTHSPAAPNVDVELAEVFVAWSTLSSESRHRILDVVREHTAFPGNES